MKVDVTSHLSASQGKMSMVWQFAIDMLLSIATRVPQANLTAQWRLQSVYCVAQL
jgi:hypothetical protein